MALTDGTQWQKAELLAVLGPSGGFTRKAFAWAYRVDISENYGHFPFQLDDKKAANVWNNGLQFNHAAADCPICSSTIL
jgi:hypothetical protein